MPTTPLHYPIAYILKRTSNRLSLPALIVGSMIPDVEVPLLWYFFNGILLDHLILHSLIGSLTLGLILTVVSVRYFYAPVVSRIFGITRERIESECRVTKAMVLSAIVGLVGHILLDFTEHWYNPILWPWVDPLTLVGILAALFAVDGNIRITGYLIANVIVGLIMTGLSVRILLFERGNSKWERLLVGHNDSGNSRRSEAFKQG